MEWGQILQTAIPVFIAVVAGFWAWLSGRKKGNAETQEKINSGFQMLVNQLQEERMLFASDSIARTMEMRRFERHVFDLGGYVDRLSDHVRRMEAILRKHEIAFGPFTESRPVMVDNADQRPAPKSH